MRVLLGALTLAVVVWSQPAEACGCFTPPDPTVPVVQAGERILFAVHDGQVTAHVQVQYSGAGGSGDFGWLLPLPSVPTLELGTDELFARLTSVTQPRYRMDTRFDTSCRQVFAPGSGAGGGSGFGGAQDAGAVGPGSPLVIQDSVGPYDYAVLRADSQAAMLEWLAANHYFVPSGTAAVVAPYIKPGGYFLALKLRPGNTTGDLQPVVLHYQSDLGVIPITLTATGAVENMGVQVWMLGTGRAIPRNYAHTVLDDAVIDWPSSGANYQDVIIRAVGEAPGRHTFVTEYAGPSAPMVTSLAPEGRFGTKAQLAASPTPADFVSALYARGFAAPSGLAPFAGPVLSGPLKAILQRYLPPPPNVTPDSFYASYRSYAPQAPPPDFQPQAMADAIWERVVTPVQQAALLFDAMPTLTRLYSTISPADMTKDPAFSFNPSLPDVSNVHTATMTVSCDALGAERAATLVTEQGWVMGYPDGRFGAPGVAGAALPASLRIEVLREEGVPEVLVDNTPRTLTMISPVPAAGCTCQPGSDWVAVGLALLGAARARVRKSRDR